MTLGLYNIIWWLLYPFLPFILGWRVKQGKELAGRTHDRYGKPCFDNPTTGAIWLHSVSAGETIAAISLAKALAKILPKARFLITTNTVSAAAIVEKEITAGFLVSHAFQPLDHPRFVDRFLTQIQPQIAIFMESDFWPNLVSKTAAKSIPVVFASSQLSEIAYNRWFRNLSLAKSIFTAPQLVLAVDKTQACQFRQLGTSNHCITILGSLKLGNPAKFDRSLCQNLKKAVGGRKVLLAASTHDGEDAMMIEAAKTLGDDWLMIIAPRHPNRGPDIAALAMAPQRSLGDWPSEDCNLYIMDSFGEMGSLFSIADLTVLGGSFVPKGGHNPLEPAAFGLPIITGPHIFKNNAEFAGLRENGVIFDLAGDQHVMDPVFKGQALAEMAVAIMSDNAQYNRITAAAMAYAETARRRSQDAAKMITVIVPKPSLPLNKT